MADDIDTVETTDPGQHGRIEGVDLQTEMQRSYLDYAMSVIVSRALPDVRDGLKPVHRRVLYAMYDGGYRPDRNFSKSARVVGDVMGNYHPHGDSSIYDALVRLAQPWSLRYPLVQGQGNFGSPGNDPAAAMRYTECRMASLAMEMVRDIDEDTVDFGPNYDGRTPGAARPAEPVPERARQWLVRHRRRHGHEHPAAQPPRDRRGGAVDARQPAGRPRGAPDDAARHRQGPGLPDRRAHRRPQGHRRCLSHRARLDHHAGHRHGRRGRARPAGHRGHRAAVPGQPRQPAAADRRARRGGQAHRHLRRPRRLVVAVGHAADHRAQARRRGPGGAEPAVQAHPAAGHLRRQHARHRRRRPAHADHRPVHPVLDRAPDRGHPATHPLPPAQGGGARSHPARATSRPSTPSTRSSPSFAPRRRSRTPGPV